MQAAGRGPYGPDMADSDTAHDQLSDFNRRMFDNDGMSRPVYWIGSGPGVLIAPEIPGVTPDVADFARRLAAEGFTCAVASLFGTPGRPFSQSYATKTITRACIAKEFTAFTAGSSSPVTAWLRALGQHLHEEAGGPGIGVVGMCFTGGFALALAVDERVLVPVLSQPSLPLPISRSRRRAIDASDEQLRAVAARASDGLCTIGLRFTNDSLVPSERFELLREHLGDAFIAVEIDSSEGNAHGFAKDAHSVLTREYRAEPGHPTHEAHELLLAHLTQRLKD